MGRPRVIPSIGESQATAWPLKLPSIVHYGDGYDITCDHSAVVYTGSGGTLTFIY